MRILISAIFLGLVAGCGGQSTGVGPGPSDGGPLPIPVVHGTSANGSACNVDQDCAAGSCVYDDASCPGTCLAYRTSGQSCGSPVHGGPGTSCSVNGVPVACGPAPTGDCVPDSGLECDPEGLTCVPTPAVVIVGAGAACSIFGPSCGAGLYCAGPFPDNGVCQPIVAEGGACAPENPEGCADGLYCVGFGTSTDTGVCKPPAPVGGACVVATAATGTNGNSGCGPHLACVNGTCATPPASGPCVQGLCGVTSYCDSSNTCQPLQADGTPCTSDLQCQSACDLTNHCGATLCPTSGAL